MRSVLVTMTCVLALAAPAAAAPAPQPDKEESAGAIAEQMKQAVEPLDWFFVADKLWEGTNRSVKEANRDEIHRILAQELDARYKQYQDGATQQNMWAENYLLGTIPVSCQLRQTYIDLLNEQDVAIYDWNSRNLNVLKNDQVQGVPPLARRLIIMHEMAGLLDHRHTFNGNSRDSLDDRAGQQHDGRLAVVAVIEGSGRLLSKRYLAEAQRTGKISRSDTLQYAGYEESRGKRFLELPLYYQACMGAHVCGMHFLMQGKPLSALADGSETGAEALLAVKKKGVPPTTEQILHPEKFFDEKSADEPIYIEDGSVDWILDKTGGWSIPWHDTFGELICSLLARPKDPKPNPIALMSPSYYINEAGSGWGGDRFFLLRKGTVRAPGDSGQPTPENVKGAWVTVWDTPKDREEFVAAYSKNMPQAGVALIGERTAVFFLNMDAKEQEETAKKLTKNLPRLRQSGKEVKP